MPRNSTYVPWTSANVLYLQGYEKKRDLAFRSATTSFKVREQAEDSGEVTKRTEEKTNTRKLFEGKSFPRNYL